VSGWRAIVFDLDDTLYPEQAYVFSGFRAVAAWAEAYLDIPAGKGFVELKHLFEQGTRGDTFNRWLAAHGVAADELVPHLVQVYREHQPVLVPFPEVPDMLASLQRRYRLGLVSDGYLQAQQRKLAALGMAHYFDAVVFSDAWGRAAWKPSTKPFEIVLERLACGAARSMYVADNPLKDFLGARQLGMVTVRVCRPAGEYSQLSPPTPQHAPDLTIRSVTQLRQVLAK
jgi:putative hydrolase of the HAD superfamily